MNANDRPIDTPEPFDADLQREFAEVMAGQDVQRLISEASGAAAPTQSTHEAPQAHRQPHDQTATPHLARGRIEAIHGDDVFVGLVEGGGKAQGVVPLRQFERPPRVGSIMDFVVERHDESQGLLILSREGAIGRITWEQLQRGAVVEARVVGTNKGGLELEMIGGIMAFMPAGQVDLRHVDDLQQFVGQKLAAVVQEIDRRTRRVVLSRRNHLENDRRAKRAKTWEELEVGQVRQGTITRIAEFGAFVDLGGLDGLIHISELSYSRVSDPTQVVTVGQTVSVKVLKIDRDKQRINLGLKQTGADPWQGIADRVRPGDRVTLRVMRVTDFGAFVEVEPGVEGLVPASELSWARHVIPVNVVKEGDTLRLVALQVSPEQRRITLSLKQAGDDPWIGAERKYPKDSLVDGRVRSIADFGAFVELEAGVEGLVHISELSERRVNSVADVLQVDQTHKFRVIDVDEDQRRIRLSLRPASAQREPSSADAHPAGQGARPNAYAVSSRPDKHVKKQPARPLKGGLE